MTVRTPEVLKLFGVFKHLCVKIFEKIFFYLLTK